MSLKKDVATLGKMYKLLVGECSRETYEKAARKPATEFNKKYAATRFGKNLDQKVNDDIQDLMDTLESNLGDFPEKDITDDMREEFVRVCTGDGYNRISELRKEKGETQEAMAAALHVRQQYVNRWEKGNLPRFETCMKIAEHFGVPMEELVRKPGKELA